MPNVFENAKFMESGIEKCQLAALDGRGQNERYLFSVARPQLFQKNGKMDMARERDVPTLARQLFRHPQLSRKSSSI